MKEKYVPPEGWEELKKKRLALGLTINDVWKGTDINSGTISALENGGRVSYPEDKAEKLMAFYEKIEKERK